MKGERDFFWRKCSGRGVVFTDMEVWDNVNYYSRVVLKRFRETITACEITLSSKP